MLSARLSREDGPSRWEFPGGKVEDGESPEEALRREIQEELAMDIEVAEAITETDVPGAEPPMQLRLFRARWLGGGPELRDHDRVGWFDEQELDKLDWHSADIVLLQALLRHEKPTT